MKRCLRLAIAFAGLMACSAPFAHAQQLPPGPLPSPQQTPLPQTPSQQPQPRFRPDVPLAPVRQQTSLPDADFSASDQRCDAALQGATLQVGARLSVQPNPVRAGRATIDVLINGVPIGAEELRIQNGAVIVSRRVPVSGASGQHEAVFVLEGAVRSAGQPFEHNCVSRTQTLAPPPGTLTLPNLAFGNVLYTQLTPAPPPGSREVAGGRVSLGGISSFRYPIIVRDIRSLTGVIQFPSNDTCPRPQDAYVTAQFAIAVQITRVADPAEYVSVAAGPFETDASFVDTLDQPLWASGAALSHGGNSGTPLPQGYQWIVFSPGLACTRNGILEIRFDPLNRLRESNEGDNVLRLRYSTVP